jgi:hypothetical protein
MVAAWSFSGVGDDGGSTAVAVTVTKIDRFADAGDDNEGRKGGSWIERLMDDY